jgi:arginine exporter protein ArgO
MRNAPSVTYPVGRCAFWRLLLLAAGALGLSAVMAGGWWLDRISAVVGAALWVVWAAWAALSWRRLPSGRLSWDARHTVAQGAQQGGWTWHSAAYRDGVNLVQVECVQDAQRWMLLRLHNPERARIWLCVARSADPSRWDDLRRAVIAHG